MNLPLSRFLVPCTCLVMLLPCAEVRGELLGYWSFDALNLAETSKFQAPGVHDGRTEGVLRYSEDVPPGFKGYSAEFPGTTPPHGFLVSNTSDRTNADYQDTFDQRVKKAGQFTLALWIKAAPQSLEDGKDDPGLVVKWGKVDGFTAGFNLRRITKSKQLLFTTQITNGVAVRLQTSGPDLFDSTWHHVAFTRDGQTMRCYQDGKLTTSLADEMAQWVPCPGWAIVVGAISPTFAPFKGQLDELRIYDEALDEAAIQQLMRPGP